MDIMEIANAFETMVAGNEITFSKADKADLPLIARTCVETYLEPSDLGWEVGDETLGGSGCILKIDDPYLGYMDICCDDEQWVWANKAHSDGLPNSKVSLYLISLKQPETALFLKLSDAILEVLYDHEMGAANPGCPLCGGNGMIDVFVPDGRRMLGLVCACLFRGKVPDEELTCYDKILRHGPSGGIYMYFPCAEEDMRECGKHRKGPGDPFCDECQMLRDSLVYPPLEELGPRRPYESLPEDPIRQFLKDEVDENYDTPEEIKNDLARMAIESMRELSIDATIDLVKEGAMFRMMIGIPEGKFALPVPGTALNHKVRHGEPGFEEYFRSFFKLLVTSVLTNEE
jgi:hypothetical protein